jgi:hypothetical protein
VVNFMLRPPYLQVEESGTRLIGSCVNPRSDIYGVKEKEFLSPTAMGPRIHGCQARRIFATLIEMNLAFSINK